MNDRTAMKPAKPRVHPMTLGVVRYKLLAVAEEVVEMMVRTCFSPLLNQSRDFSAVVLDAKSQVVAQAERVPIHMGAMPYAVKAMHEAFGDNVAEGDILMANDPYFGGSHLPDVTLAVPVFRDGRVRLWVANRAHQGDIGGMSAGGYSPNAREIWHEGLRIPPVKLAERGALREDLLRLVCVNSRKPDDMRGDILAQIASVTIGARRLQELFDRYGTEQIEGCVEGILEAGEASMRGQLSRCKPGQYTGVAYIEDDGAGGRNVPITAHVTIESDRATVDFGDCPAQVASFMNSPYANTVACTNVAFLYLSEDRQAQNDGCSRAIEVKTRRGSILDCTSPMPVTGCTTFTSAAIIEAVLRALEKSAPDGSLARLALRFRFALAGRHRGWTNLGCIHNTGGSLSPSIERTEAGYPFQLVSFELRQDSGGAGYRRGGLGGTYALRYEGEGDALINAAGEGLVVAPYGVDGGSEGAVHRYEIVRADGTRAVLGIRDTSVPVEARARTRQARCRIRLRVARSCARRLRLERVSGAP